MEKYSESVKDAQEKLEQAEKKATDVSVDLDCRGTKALRRNPRLGHEGRGEPRSLQYRERRGFLSVMPARAGLHK